MGGVSCNMHSLSSLPPELLCKILSPLAPENTRTLRYVVTACFNTDHENVGRAAEEVLRDQQAWLRDRWRRIHARTSVPLGAPDGIETIVEQLIGKQYVRAAEVVDSADHWVSIDQSTWLPAVQCADLRAS